MRYVNVVLMIVFLLFMSKFGFAQLELPDSPAAPDHEDSAMYTIEDIYNRLDSGTAGSKRGATFVEPGAGPAATGKSLDDVMDKAPTVDDAAGAIAAEVTKDKTFWGLTSGEWGLQTGTLEPGGGIEGVARTGQTTSYGTRDDGELQQGVAWPNPRFTDNKDGTVTDNLTGLIWLKNANCANATRNWDTALADVVSLNTNGTMNGNNCGDTSNAGGHQTDWSLPNVLQLLSLIAWGYYDPALSNTAGTAKWTEGDPFSGVQSSFYWSGTTIASSTSFACSVYLFYGFVDYDGKASANYVWPVRAGQ